MAATYDSIIKELSKKVYHPVYFLTGDEPYYIDRVSSYIEKHVLSESEKEFNQTVLYGKEVDLPSILNHAKRYPMMANHQVVIVKEAQDVKDLFAKGRSGKQSGTALPGDDENPLLKYLSNPQKTTILVFCYKYKKVDGRTKLGKTIAKDTVFLKSAKVYPDKMGVWIGQYASDKNYRIGEKGASMLSDFLGNDLSKVANEMDKLMINIDEGSEVTPELIEKYIGISKDFNIFELQEAVGAKDHLKAQRIVKYFARNPRANPFPVSVSLLFMYFRRLMAYHALSRKGSRISREQKASVLGINPFFLRGIEQAARNYPLNDIVQIIELLQIYDMKSKGFGNISTDTGELLKELVFKIMHPVQVTA